MALEQDNGVIVRRLFERVWNDGDLSAIEDLVDDDFTNFGVRRPGGHAAMRHIVTAWRTAFPDLRYEIQEEIVHGDKVVHRVMLRGTHLGEFPPGVGPARIMGAMPPTGRSFEADQIHITPRRGRQDRRARRQPQRPAAPEPARPGIGHPAGDRDELAQAGDSRCGAKPLS